MPQHFDIDTIRQIGFDGFVTISELQASGCCSVPEKPGVYFVVRAKWTHPEFLQESTGGHFKGRNPTVPVGLLETRWVENAIVLYIGRAGPKRSTLKNRLKEYMRFGQGVPVGHGGGRYIWQLRGFSDLLVCWKAIPAEPNGVGHD